VDLAVQLRKLLEDQVRFFSLIPGPLSLTAIISLCSSATPRTTTEGLGAPALTANLKALSRTWRRISSRCGR
jgi:hypothetical protein